MARIEAYQSERLSMPQPGTLEYFSWLSSLDAQSEFGNLNARAFLEQAHVAKGFIGFIRVHRTQLPLRREYRADLDSTRLQLGPSEKGIFKGSVEINPDLPNHGALILHGQPNPEASHEDNYTYDAFIPLRLTAPNYFAIDYDSNRPLQAVYNWKSHEDIRHHRSLAFSEISYPEYGRDDPLVLINAVQEAARDLYGIFHEQFGSCESNTELAPSSRDLARWHPDYMKDDPDEFNPNHKVLK